MSLSTCEKCGGHIPLGPDASNRCEVCGAFVFPTGIHPAKRTMEGGFSLDKFLSGISKEDAETLGDMFDAMEEEKRLNGWIKCEDSMPPEDKANSVRVLTWDGQTVREGRRYWDCLMHSFRWDDCYRMPTHWMPLPKPPTE